MIAHVVANSTRSKSSDRAWKISDFMIDWAGDKPRKTAAEQIAMVARNIEALGGQVPDKFKSNRILN